MNTNIVTGNVTTSGGLLIAYSTDAAGRWIHARAFDGADLAAATAYAASLDGES